MTDEAITIMAKAIEQGIDTSELVLTDPLTLRRIKSERLAKAALEALRAAGYWVERWRPIEEAPGEIALLLAASDGTAGKATMDFRGEWAWNDEEWLRHDQRPIGWVPLPPPPVQSEGGGG